VHRGDLDSSGGGGAYLVAQRRYEQEYRHKIERSLAFVPNVTVQVDVQLDHEKSTYTNTVEALKGVTSESSEKSSNHNREGGGGSGGRPGYQSSPNAPATLSSASKGGSHDEEESTDVKERIQPGTKQIVRESVGLTPQLVKVQIGIPNSYFEKVWRERNPPPAGQEAKPPEAAALEQIRVAESKKIQAHVAAGLPTPQGIADPTQLVTITTFQDIKPLPISPPGIGQQVVVWLAEYWRTLGLIGLAVVSLMVLRSMVRAVPNVATSEPVQMRVAAEPEPQKNETVENVAARRLRRFTGSGPSLRDELSELVQEDPDAAANILRSWIGSSN
jgi:flagellar M-ring protein FliF